MNYLLTFDIETIRRAPKEALKNALRSGDIGVDYQLKDIAKVAAKFQEKFHYQVEGASPVSVAFAVIDLTKRVITKIVGVQSNDEKVIGEFVLDTLDEYCPKKLVGFNSEKFDLPILEYVVSNACDRGLKLYRGVGKWDHIDIAKNIPQFFNVFRPLKGEPHSVADIYGIPYSGKSGADVAEMWEADLKHGTQEVLKYNKEDAWITAQVFLKMMRLRNFI